MVLTLLNTLTSHVCTILIPLMKLTEIATKVNSENYTTELWSVVIEI